MYNIAQDFPEDVPQNIPEDVPNDVPQDVTENAAIETEADTQQDNLTDETTPYEQVDGSQDAALAEQTDAVQEDAIDDATAQEQTDTVQDDAIEDTTPEEQVDTAQDNIIDDTTPEQQTDTEQNDGTDDAALAEQTDTAQYETTDTTATQEQADAVQDDVADDAALTEQTDAIQEDAIDDATAQEQADTVQDDAIEDTTPEEQVDAAQDNIIDDTTPEQQAGTDQNDGTDDAALAEQTDTAQDDASGDADAQKQADAALETLDDTPSDEIESAEDMSFDSDNLEDANLDVVPEEDNGMSLDVDDNINEIETDDNIEKNINSELNSAYSEFEESDMNDGNMDNSEYSLDSNSLEAESPTEVFETLADETTEQPAELADTPCESTEQSVEETEAPAEQVEQPAEETEVLAETTEQPVELTYTPDETTEQPVKVPETPAEQVEQPAEETEIPENTNDIDSVFWNKINPHNYFKKILKNNQKDSLQRKFEDYSIQEMDLLMENDPELARKIMQEYRTREPIDYSKYDGQDIPTDIKLHKLLDQIPSRYHQDIINRFDNSEDIEKAIFEQYTNEMIFDNIKRQPPTEAWFNSKDGKITMNIEEDSKNPRGSYATLFHENGHMIDYLSQNGMIDKSWLSSDTREGELFYQALKEDYNNYVKNEKNNYYNEYGVNPNDSEFQKYISNKLHGATYSNISDILDGVSLGFLRSDYGHSDFLGIDSNGIRTFDASYWKEPGNIQREAFTHFFEANMGASPERKIALISNFPKAHEVYKTMINKIRR